MSEENVEIVRKCLDVYNAFMRGELSREAAVEATAQFVRPATRARLARRADDA